MKLKKFDHMNCSLAQALDIIGERWTLLILRDVFFGIKRFDQLQASLGIARNILTARLNRLVEEAILEKRPAEGARYEYRLTEKGQDLQTVLLSITHWGDRHKPNPNGPRLTFVEKETGAPIAPMAVRASDGRILGPRDIKAVRGPGMAPAQTSGPKPD